MGSFSSFKYNPQYAQTLATAERELNLTRGLAKEEAALAVQTLEEEYAAIADLDVLEVHKHECS